MDWILKFFETFTSLIFYSLHFSSKLRLNSFLCGLYYIWEYWSIVRIWFRFRKTGWWRFLFLFIILLVFVQFFCLFLIRFDHKTQVDSHWLSYRSFNLFLLNPSNFKTDRQTFPKIPFHKSLIFISNNFSCLILLMFSSLFLFFLHFYPLFTLLLVYNTTLFPILVSVLLLLIFELTGPWVSTGDDKLECLSLFVHNDLVRPVKLL